MNSGNSSEIAPHGHPVLIGRGVVGSTGGKGEWYFFFSDLNLRGSIGTLFRGREEGEGK
jgi:hypothetical protein